MTAKVLVQVSLNSEHEVTASVPGRNELLVHESRRRRTQAHVIRNGGG